MIRPLALALSLAQPQTLGVPPWPLAPDGERVAVFGDAPLEAEGARVERESGRTWRVVPSPGRDTVVLRAGGSPVTAAVGPPAGRILVSFDPPAPVKGRDRAVRIRLDVRTAAGEPLAPEAPPRVFASVGKLGPLAAGSGPGTFEAQWEPSDSPQPEVLGIVAIAPRCPLCATSLAAGTGRLPVAAAIELPGRTDPGVETSVEIAGRVWGPVRADAEGRFTLPVVVPPGTRWGFATSQSSLGNARRTKLDLHLSDAPGFSCARWPERVPADGRTESGLLCTAWSANGGPADPRALRASAARGKVHGGASDGTAWRARYVPPAQGAGADRILVEWPPAARAELAVELATGAPAAIEWRTEGEPAVPGSRLRVSARALDVRGDPLGDAVAADGSIEGGRLAIRAALGDGIQRVTLVHAVPPGGTAASVSLHRVGKAWVAAVRDVAGRAVSGVALRFGAGTREVTDARGEARAPAAGDVETVEGPGGLRAAGWAAASTPVPALSVEREVLVALRPPGSVDVAAALAGGWLRWTVVGPDGTALAGREVAVESGTVALGPVEKDGDGGRCAVRGGKGTVAITDVQSGATALLEVR